MKLIRLVGVVLGLLLCSYLIYQVGWATIWDTLRLLRWNYIWVLGCPLSWILLNTVGLRRAFRRHITVPFIQLVEIRLAGETFNSLLPSGYIGGEPLKAKLLTRFMPLREATAGVLIAKAAQSVALVLFLGLGLTLAETKAVSGLPSRAPWIALALLACGILIFTRLLAHQAFSRIGRGLYWLTRVRWFSAQEIRLSALDETLGAFYREGKLAFSASVLWHLAGWLAGACELMLIFFLLGHPLDWRQAWFMGAMAQLAAIVALIVPAGVGFYEAGHYVAAVVLGVPPSLGLSASLIRRVRELFWDGVGLAVFWHNSKQAGSPDENR